MKCVLASSHVPDERIWRPHIAVKRPWGEAGGMLHDSRDSYEYIKLPAPLVKDETLACF